MKKIRIITIRKKILIFSVLIFISLLIAFPYCIQVLNPVHEFIDPENGIIMIDPGHGGIDGGTNKEGILEKEINLSIALKVKTILEKNGYTVLMTREDDKSLEDPNRNGQSRHRSDLNTRVNMINSSNAQLFISIHVNCNLKKPTTNGSIVFFGDRFPENKLLAMSIQKKLNLITLDNGKRMIHDPREAQFYVLDNAKIPGAIVETAFISNSTESRLLTEDYFRDQLASAICDGIMQYLFQQNQVIM